MRPFNKRIIVTVDKRVKDTIKVGEIEFALDNIFRSAWNTVQKASVVFADPSCDVTTGDEVFVHHFISENENRLPFMGGLYSWLEYNQIYARKRDGEIKMLNNYIFIEPIRYDNTQFFKEEDGIFLTDKKGSDFVERMGKVAFLSDSCISAGLKTGDVVLFCKNCEYEIDIDGRTYYRMELRDVITTVDDQMKVRAIKA